MKSTGWQRLIGTISVVVFLSLVGWRLTCPALIRFRSGPMEDSTLALVPNPIRSGQAMRAAGTLLKLLRDKDSAGVARMFPALDAAALRTDTINPPVRWALKDIVAEQDGGLDFEYLDATANERDLSGYFWIYCARDAQGVWTIRRYERVF
jgi:hypothetical protein